MTNGFILRENTCPTCNCVVNAACMPDGTPLMPEPGDISICIGCGEILQFDRSMKLHKMNKSQLNQLQVEHPDVWFDAIKAQGLTRSM